MIAGLPGTGIGGLYYLIASGWMLLREGWSKLNKQHDLSRSKIVKKQVLLALFIVAGMWATGELVGRLLASDLMRRLLELRALSNGKYNLWKTSILYWTAATLVSLYLLMQSIRLALRISGYVGTLRLAIDAPPRAALQGQIILEPIPALEPTRGMAMSEQTEEQSVL
jgi:hypothetical protein